MLLGTPRFLARVGGGTPKIAMERRMEQGFHSGAYEPCYSLFIASL